MPIYEPSFILLVFLPLQEVPLVAGVFEFFSIHNFLKVLVIYVLFDFRIIFWCISELLEGNDVVGFHPDLIEVEPLLDGLNQFFVVN